MNNQIFLRSKALNNIPPRKLQEILSSIEKTEEDFQAKNIKLIAVNRYAESNIPIEYWSLKMEKDFHGDSRLLNKHNEYTQDLKKSYLEGASVCFAGSHGLGKTFTVCSVLKKASSKGFTCLYTTLSDIVNVLTSASNEDKFIARRELGLVDFLVIDEFDSRFISSDNAADLYARTLENIFRTRSQNKLPTLMCTNSPNIIESFNGPLKASIDSLMKGYLKLFPVFGEDYRKKKVI
jgi:DNA replication protein DnaC